MKIIKNGKTIRVYAFVFALMLTLLLSSMIGTIVWAEKPDKPRGKRFETWDIKIWIEEPGTDVVLLTPEHPGEDPPEIYLFAEDVPCSGGLWDVPKKKGGAKTPNPNNYLYASVDLMEYYEDDCGTYQLPQVVVQKFEEGQDIDEDIVYFSISHHVWPLGEGEDYWTFTIQWEHEPDPDYEFHILRVRTNTDDTLEGELSEEEGWTVPFDAAEAILYSDWTDDNNDGEPDVLDWAGTLSFTVRITRTLHVPSP